MSHKDYVLLAGALAEGKPDTFAPGAFVNGYATAVLQVARALARDNPRFDRERFMAAARGEPVNGRDRVRS
jgi:hypothetical protein